MARVRVVFYREQSGRVPTQDWLENLPKQHRRKCQVAIEKLREAGHQLKHPHVHRIRDGIHELRIRFGRSQYRLLYFWHGGTVAVLSHGIAKKTSAVPQHEIQRALRRKRAFEENPNLHTQEID